MRSVLVSLCAVVFGWVGGGDAEAASISVLKGRVTLNTGTGFQDVQGTVSARPGASVLASPGALAEIVYDNGCHAMVASGAVVAVAENPTCAPRSNLGARHCSLKDAAPNCKDIEAAALEDHHLIAGGLVVGAAIAAIIAISDDDKPASP